MFWTHWVRGICKVLMVIEIVASVIIGCTLIVSVSGVNYIERIISILVTIVGVILIAITSNALIMMISEISVNIYKVKNQLCGKEEIETEEETESEDTFFNSDDIDENQTWTCKNCGKNNFIYQSRCSFCDAEHDENKKRTN